MPTLTIERLLSSIGFGSRKESRALVRMGLVELNGEMVEDPFMELSQRPKFITVNNEEVSTEEKLYIMLYKPIDIECSHKPKSYPSVYSLIPERFSAMGIQTVGRLDANSSGLLLLSNQGDFIHKVESPKKGHFKKYKVELARPFTEKNKQELLNGILLKGERRPVFAKEVEIGENEVFITIGEGIYHQVRRMFASIGNHVLSLERISIGSVQLDKSLGLGGWRNLTPTEIETLS